METFTLIGLFPVITTNLAKHTGPGSVPAFEMAIDAINNNRTILKNYRIDYGIANSACERDTVMHEFVANLQKASKDGNLRKIVGYFYLFFVT